MEVPPSLISAFPPSADLLLDCARRDIDDAMLMDIARADYGYMADEMLVELRPIRDNGVIPLPMSGMLHEVLSLTRWCNPDQPEKPPFEPGPTGKRGHQTRLFVCAVLLRAAAENVDQFYDDVVDSTLAQALNSAHRLSGDINEASGSFMTWWQLNVDQPLYAEASLFFALGLLMLATRLRAGRFTEQELGTIAEWVFSKEIPSPKSSEDNPFPWPPAFSIQQGFWKPLTAELHAEAATIQDDKVRGNIQLCASY